MLAGASVTKTEQWAATALFAGSRCRPEIVGGMEQAAAGFEMRLAGRIARPGYDSGLSGRL